MQVLIIEAQIKQYRLPLFEKLRRELTKSGMELRVAYSDPNSGEATKKDNCDLPLDYGKKVRGRWFFHNKILFQPLIWDALCADLVIVDQGNRFVLNHLLLPLCKARFKRVAFWGLGQNLQAGQIRISEWYRRKTLNAVSWWFAYTRGTARYLIRNGVPPRKITAVDNAVDTSAIRQCVESISPTHRASLRARLGISAAARVAIFCGMLDKVKGVPFLIQSAKMIRDRVDDFHLILVGGGPEAPSIRSDIEGTPWIHYMGPQFGERKSELIAISDVFLMPGRVGLVILDAFAAGLPLLSTRLEIHGPEMEYLEEGQNGLLSDPEVAAFSNMAATLLLDETALEALRHGARRSGSKYTVENMVANFKQGIDCCLRGEDSPQVAFLGSELA